MSTLLEQLHELNHTGTLYPEGWATTQDDILVPADTATATKPKLSKEARQRQKLNLYPEGWRTSATSLYRFQPVDTPTLPVGKWDVIYADPAYRYNDNLGFKAARGAPDYPTMPFEKICQMPVKEIRTQNSFLFLWCTWPMIAEGKHVLLADAWGFKLVCLAFAWVKLRQNAGGTEGRDSDQFLRSDVRPGLGWWTMGQSEVCFLGASHQMEEEVEFCFLGRCGHPKRVAKNVKEVQIWPITTHSRKPPEIRDEIDRLVGMEARRIELFARTPGLTTTGDGMIAAKWDLWGLEAQARINVEEYL